MSPSENFDVTHVTGPSYSLDDGSSMASRIAVASRIALASTGSQGTMGGLLVAGFVSYICRDNKVNCMNYA
jgi:hypothetical protein